MKVLKIIDKETGKRLIDASKSTKSGAEELKEYKKKMRDEDPIIRNVEKDEDSQELSAMDPPSAYDEKRKIGGDKDQMDKFLQDLIEDHKRVKEETEKFDAALKEFKENGFEITHEMHKVFNNFFVFFDEEVLPHNQKEEKYYFRVLEQRLKEDGEHGSEDKNYTAIELMEDDHIKFIQLAALSFNLLGLGSRLQDPQSRALTMDIAYNSGRELVELLNLHIFREDETLFPMSQKLLTEDDFAYINEAHEL